MLNIIIFSITGFVTVLLLFVAFRFNAKRRASVGYDPRSCGLLVEHCSNDAFLHFDESAGGSIGRAHKRTKMKSLVASHCEP